MKRLQKDADKVLALEVVSVMDKSVVAPSGDKHDYLSYGRYYWPDPSKPDGLPYIQRDGQTNPDVVDLSDHVNLQQVVKSVHTLGLTHFFTGNNDYAERAARILRTWFLNPDTRMSPNLNYGQIIKGKDAGRRENLRVHDRCTTQRSTSTHSSNLPCLAIVLVLTCGTINQMMGGRCAKH